MPTWLRLRATASPPTPAKGFDAAVGPDRNFYEHFANGAQRFRPGQPEPALECSERSRAGQGALNGGGREPQPCAARCYGHAGRLQRSYVPGPGQLGAPRARFGILEHNLVRLVVCDVALRQRLTKIERNCSLRSGHRIFLSTKPIIEPNPDQCRGKVEMSSSWQSGNVAFSPDSVEGTCYYAGVGEAETGSAGEQPDRGIAGRNSSRTMSRARSFRRVP
jgi:hypothetical protein